ncbi:hypothetical protein EOI86_05325 [Hwanghaeella grinnelliae]|uniref:Uncharacterized protein n=1 Tax=Hwanghaeella grinnelliae TaxID=2500179 RepID=A0A437QVY6_9PROT|nr:hypothetical protein [Hwanghaeella grinnelliae]RVU38694.1 hypothetical protein EOI86_05325 [Hwanghaeella grinnelliae]
MMLEKRDRTQLNEAKARRAGLIAVVLFFAVCVYAGQIPASAETPREKKQAEPQGSPSRPAFQPRSSGTSQQQERQDTARPAPVRKKAKPGESQQDARKRRNKERALGQ